MSYPEGILRLVHLPTYSRSLKTPRCQSSRKILWIFLPMFFFSFFSWKGKASSVRLVGIEGRVPRAWESSFEERSNLLRVTRESFGAKKLLGAQASARRLLSNSINYPSVISQRVKWKMFLLLSLYSNCIM